MTPDTHALYRIALSEADTIDPTGRFRAILHLLRCADPGLTQQILSSRVDALLLNPREAREAMKTKGQTTSLHGALLLPDTAITLDEEAVSELQRFLSRRRRQSRHLLTKYNCRGGRYYVCMVCGGGRVVRSLKTTDRNRAAARLMTMRRGLREAARARDCGLLFSERWKPKTHVTMRTFREWLSQAIGRQASSSQLSRCAKPLPRRRVKWAPWN